MSATNEYAFFEEEARDSFIARLDELGIPNSQAVDPAGGWTVILGGEVEEDTLDDLEDYYDELLAQQAAAEGMVGRRLAGIQVTLVDGTVRTLKLDPDTANLLLSNFTPEEAQAVAQAIVTSLETSTDGPLCRR
jgi:hypothetical protein